MPDITRFFHPVLASRELRSGPVLVQLAGSRFALWRDREGRPAAVSDACPHRRAPLSCGKVRPDGKLACGYHGWYFDSHGHGRSPSQPTLTHCDTTSYQVFDRYGYVWLASRDSRPEAFPSLGWEGFEQAGSFSQLFRAPLHVALDNFSEDEHFPYIHFFLGWNDRGLDELEFDARNLDDRTEVVYRGPQRPSPWLPLLGVRAGDRFQNEWATFFDPVRAIFTFHWFDRRTNEERPLVIRTAVFMVPETAATTRFHVIIFMKIRGRVYRWIRPIVHRATTHIGRRDVAQDAAWIPNMADTPLELEGMRLGKFDKPVIRNRKLLQSIYWAEPKATASVSRVEPSRQGSGSQKE